MAINQMSEVISHFRRTVLLREGVGLTDGQLLQDYLSCREEAALEALVRRHAPMVWGVCRRVLGNHHDAEDAFQATFLILVRKAASINSPKLLANWLYGVAHQTARKARATAVKRRARERQVTRMPEPAAPEPDLWNDVQPLLDQELSRLPVRYRVAIVLCDVEGKTRKEAARQLGVPEGTLAARVARGRVMLAKRLARHGLAVSGGALGAMLAQNEAPAGVPAVAVSSTIKAASLCAAGQTAAVGLISAEAAVLTEGVLQSMLLRKLKVAVVLLLALGALGVGASALPYRTVAAAPSPPVSKSAVPPQDEGNIKEEAHTTSDTAGKVRRRDLVKTVAGAGGLLAPGNVAPADEADKTGKLPGEWLYDGKQDRPCAIFQHGRVLLLVNEEGELATARLTGARKFVVLKGYGWGEEGLVGELDENGKAISWSNGTTWKRP
jgi:RNA polymerase sigma factor (sigma-70 family)